MKYLILMRHAKSSWKDDSLADHERPLKKRGKRDAPRMGQHIREQGLLLDAVFCSTAVRATETANGFLDAYAYEGDPQYLDDLYHADPETIFTILKQLPEEVETAMVIGHNPGLDEFLDQGCDVSEHMPTASVAYIRFPVDSWSNMKDSTRGELLQFWKPREI